LGRKTDQAFYQVPKEAPSTLATETSTLPSMKLHISSAFITESVKDVVERNQLLLLSLGGIYRSAGNHRISGLSTEWGELGKSGCRAIGELLYNKGCTGLQDFGK
jgi:hypothetical protein